MKWVVYALIFCGAFYAGLRVRAATPAFPRVITDTIMIYRERPTVVIRWRDRIRWRSVPPVVVATGPEGQKDTAAVRAYCNTLKDTSRVRPVLPDFRGRVKGSQVQFWSTLNDGRAYSSIYRVRGREWQWVSHADSLIVRDERIPFWLFRGLPGKALLFGAGMVTAKVLF